MRCQSICDDVEQVADKQVAEAMQTMCNIIKTIIDDREVGTR